MANLEVRDGDGSEAFIGATGTGTDGDPFVLRRESEQATHDDLNCNANMQIGDADVGAGNAVPVSDNGASLTVDIGAGTNNIGDVDILTIAAGETHIGQVAGHLAILEVTLSLNAAVAYADGDVLADSQEIASAVRTAAGAGLIKSIEVLDEDDQGIAFDVIFLDADVSLGTENVAVAVTDANARNILGRVEIAAGDFYDMGGCQIATKEGLDLAVKGVAASTSLYIAAVSRGAGTYTANGIRLRIGIEQF